jgi:glutamate-ammonia-ligase adenylyltransferase
MTTPLFSRIATTYPPGTDQEAVGHFWADVPAEDAKGLEPARPLINSIVSGSPYLRELLKHHAAFAAAVLSAAPEQTLESLCSEARASATLESSDDVMKALRQTKAKAALFFALADLGGAWSVDEVTAALTRFADSCLKAAIDHLLRDGHRSGKLVLADVDRPSEGCGYVALAMGKHGAFELNYSSDIDLIILFDPETAPLAPGVEPSTHFVRFTRKLVGIMQDVTADGYVFRTDLRLRPDPRATQIAISLESAATYYENLGQNWERAAMIKARPAAGDIALGEEFLGRLKSYVWRKYLDFAAIADVQSLKRQIHAVKGHAEIAIHGHNLKLGRGGIREIEFFVQTQQLIAGGRNPALRGRSTLAMLDALAEAKWITPEAAGELKQDYRFLRTIEHRVQMVADQQTHALPEDDSAFLSLARFSGFTDAEGFAARIRTTLERVQGHYAALFEDAPELGTDSGSLVFTGGEDDPGTLETLQRMGFREASEMSATIRGWHFSRYAATRSAKARELLTELMPALLTALSRNGDPDQCFLAFDRFIAGLPAGVQLFSMLKANPKLLDLIAAILGMAPRLASQLSQQPRILEAVLDPAFFGPLPKSAELISLIDQVMPAGVPLDELADRARVVGREQIFRVGVRVLTETVSAEEAGRGFSQVAELLVDRLHRAVTDDLESRHGAIDGGRSCVLAMGKLGGREMTAGSDLDLVLVYGAAEGADMSAGAKPLSINQFYSRLTQRLITAVSAPTAEGTLFEVDMRLRPSGNKGPVATSLSSFEAYHQGSAWTWEKLALTRARVVAGDDGLRQELQAAIRLALCQPRDEARTREDVRDMRRLMVKEQGQSGVWDIKRVRGGLVEVEFIAQYLQLIHAAAHPDVLDTNTAGALTRLRSDGLLDSADAEPLLEICHLYHRVTQVLRLCLDGPFDPATAPGGLNQAVARAAQMPDIGSAELALREAQAKVAGLFDRLIGSLD